MQARITMYKLFTAQHVQKIQVLSSCRQSCESASDPTRERAIPGGTKNCGVASTNTTFAHLAVVYRCNA